MINNTEASTNLWNKMNDLASYLSILLALILPVQASSQSSFYYFSYSSDTYTAISSPTELIPGGKDDTITASHSIGFTFVFNGISYTTYKVSSNGWINLGGALTSHHSTNELSHTTKKEIIAPLWDDLEVNSGGSIGYHLEINTSSPYDSVLTIEFDDMDFAGYGTSMDFQIKLYDSTQNFKIEFCYGDMGTWSEKSASIGFNDEEDNSFLSVTPGTIPDTSYTNANDNIATHNYLSNGLVYAFAPNGNWKWWNGKKSTQWNRAGNWQGGIIPSSTTDVTIARGKSNYPDITITTAACKKLHLNAGSVTIDTDGELTTHGKIKNKATFTIKSEAPTDGSSRSSGTGSFICDGKTTSNGTFVVERYLPDGGWHLVTASTTDVTANDFYWNDTPKSWLASHAELTNAWTYNTDLGTVMPVGQGWTVWIDNSKTDVTAIMEGDIQTSDFAVSLSYSGSGNDQGWNLIGNPFTSAIDRDLGTWGTNTTGAVYVWDNDYDADGEYLTWSGGSGTLTGGIIPISQGFFVKSSSAGSFTIPSAARVHSTQAFYKSTENDIKPFVRLALTTAGYKSDVFVGFPKEGTWQFDKDCDADRLYGNYESPQMIIPEDGRELCINATPPLSSEEERVIPLHIMYFIDGEYTLKISDLENLPDVNIHLEDFKSGTMHNFTNGQNYSFSAQEGDDPYRFRLHFKAGAFGINEFLGNHSDYLTIYSLDQTIYIHSEGPAMDEKGKLKAFNLLGQLYFEQEIEGAELISIPVELTNSYLIVKVIKPSGVKTEKVFIR